MDSEVRNKTITGVVILIALSLIIGRCVNLQNTRQYHIRQAEANVAQAKSTSDLGRVVMYLDAALSHIEQFDGNDDWLYPTNATDWQGIKDDIISVRDTCQAFIDNNITFQELSYQQFIHNLEDTLPSIDYRLEQTRFIRLLPYIIWSILLWVILFAAIAYWVYLFDWL